MVGSNNGQGETIVHFANS